MCGCYTDCIMKDEWSPALTIKKCVRKIRDALHPKIIKKQTCFLNSEANSLRNTDWKKFWKIATLWVHKHAI